MTNDQHNHSYNNANDCHLSNLEKEEEFCKRENEFCENLKIIPDCYM